MFKQWGYGRAFARCGVIAAVGVALQLILGDFSNEFLRYPWGVILAVNYLYVLLLVYVQSARWKWLQQLFDGYTMVASLTAMMVLTIIFGLTRQDPATQGWVGALGLSRMTSSWIFNLMLLYFVTALGLCVMRDLHHWRKVRLAALMSHLVVFVALAAAMFGSADKERVMVELHQQRLTYEGVNSKGEQVELPFGLTLKEFSMEEWPAKLYIVDTRTQQYSQHFLLADAEGAQAEIDGWRLRVGQSIDMAARMPESEEWREINHIGAAPAIRVEAEHLRSGKQVEGWVSCGSFIFEPQYLWLGERYVVVMSPREAKRYLSEVEVMDGSGRVSHHQIEVNKPARIGSWRIYQVGYDTQRGRWSTSSVVECVRDGWWSVVQVALWLLLSSGVVMFLTAQGKRQASKNKEGRV
jgi:hypothetical protein